MIWCISGSTRILRDARCSTASFPSWRPKDTVRFYALRLREAGFIKSTPQKIISENTGGLKFLRRLFATPALAKHIIGENLPGPGSKRWRNGPRKSIPISASPETKVLSAAVAFPTNSTLVKPSASKRTSAIY